MSVVPADATTSVDTQVPHDYDYERQEKKVESELDNEKDGKPANDVDELPEGGLAAWTTVLGSFLIQFCGFGYTSSFGVYQDYYTRIYITNESSSTISWIGSVNAFLVIAGGLVAGRLFDKGYFYFCVWGGSLLQAFSLFMLSLAKPNNFYQVFLSQGLGAGIGAGMIYVPSVAVVSHYFRKRRALAMTLIASGSSLGAIVHPIMLNNTLNRHLGFGSATRANAGLITGMLLIACLLMRTRLPPPKTVTHLGKSLKKFSRDWAYIWAISGLMFFSTGYYFPLFYLQLDVSVRGIDPTFAFYSLVILNAASFVGRLLPGLIAHKLGVPNMITFGTGCCTVLIFSMIGLKSIAGFVVFGLFFGFFAGTYITLMGPLMATLSDDMSELGARMGIAFSFAGIGSLIAGPISGALLTEHFVWWKPAVFSGIFALTGFLSFLMMLVMLRRRNRKQVSLSQESTIERKGVNGGS